MSWSPQQDAALQAVRRWIKQPRGRTMSRAEQVYYLAGYAGTGKTTLAKELAEGVAGGAVFGAFTGKAALVLRTKGCEGASTIHSLIYQVDEEDEDSFGGSPKFKLSPFSPVKTAGLVVIDECSMVDEELGADLLSFGTKVLVLGDPAQLPPVRGQGYFTAGTPDTMLTEVHRQAAENPIIRMSMDVRMGKPLTLGRYGESLVIDRAQLEAENVMAADQVLVGMNRTRRNWNRRIRQLKGHDPAAPQVGDRLVCLKNDRAKQLLNGGLWTVQGVGAGGGRRRAIAGATPLLGGAPPVAVPDAKGRLVLRVVSEDEALAKPRTVSVLPQFFDGTDEAAIPREAKKGTSEFTYGYALTTHKSQGSQWNDVLVLDEGGTFREDATRWRYTAITRAAERLTVVL